MRKKMNSPVLLPASAVNPPGCKGASVWVGLWALLMSGAWLIPNHYRPWPSFHADTVSGFAMLLLAACLLIKVTKEIEWNAMSLVVLGLSGVPLGQWLGGLLPFAGQAWMATTYLLGALISMQIGQLWRHKNGEQCESAIFLAVGIGGVVSVGLQLFTWLGLQNGGLHDIWSMGLVNGRPYANMGQPNQLATLLLWGILAAAWGYQSGKISAISALLLAAYLLVGVALTQSRTAWIGLSFMLAATWLWRAHWRSHWLPWCSIGLFALFWFYPIMLQWLSSSLLISSDEPLIRLQIAGENRHQALMLFAKAAMTRPWLGYGWAEVGVAQMEVAAELPGLGMTFGHSHNLFMDLVLWMGIPMGMVVATAIVAGYIHYIRAICSGSHLILVMFLGVIGIHSMLELPLHYAYFLLPAAMVMGVLNVRSELGVVRKSGRWVLWVLWLAAALLYAGIVRDYFKVEANYQSLRFERARVGTLPVEPPPDVLLLTQLRALLRFMRYDFQPGMTTTELQWASNVANSFPSGANLYRVASALAVNDKAGEAQQWLRKVCKVVSRLECEQIRLAWARDAATNERVAKVKWPD